MRRIVTFAFFFFATLFLAAKVTAHEVRPAYLQVTETSQGTFDVVWKQPVLEGKRLKIQPVFPQDCAEIGSRDIHNNGATASESFQIECALKTGVISLEGLERTLTDAFIRIDYLDGTQNSGVIKPSAPRFDLGVENNSPASDYIKIGIDHIIYGWDHLLFVIGLVMLVSRRQIIGVATAFTVAHSLTLVLAALGYLSLPTRPVEILIAMSIVLLAIEVIRKSRGGSSIATRKPYLISFVIGLIHGCGFASALSDIGLPKGTELLALLLFNLGVELGQIAIIALLLILLWLATKAFENSRKPIEIGSAYLLGTIAMFWTVQRLSDYFIT
jgi:hypothetical protein